ncbi:fimbrial protein [Pseudomonas mosselii]|uniref:Fimbrial protein n=1 Tax=Pseudomonas mosselii TaxID=78327 RepID=A0AA42RTB3_9PSED|nr:fimbrial protein [Pseudomonas mosselii]MDH1629554.1 fimbrial protein [Pseudomonas mosselii]
MTAPATSINVAYPGCTLKAPDTVQIPKTNANLLRSPGEFSSGTSFTLTLTCLPGIKARYSMTDVTDSGNRSSELGLIPDAESARGVALQIVDGSEPITFGEDSSSPSAINKRDFGVVPSGGVLSKVFSVRYIRSAGALAPGKVRSAASITMSYM